jgi:hypothetical protein
MTSCFMWIMCSAYSLLRCKASACCLRVMFSGARFNCDECNADILALVECMSRHNDVCRTTMYAQELHLPGCVHTCGPTGTSQAEGTWLSKPLTTDFRHRVQAAGFGILVLRASVREKSNRRGMLPSGRLHAR